MTHKVTMFVWNEFSHDARVLRECTALAEAGYIVNLIALRGRAQPRKEQLREGFVVYRVRFCLPTVTKMSEVFLLGLIATCTLRFFPLTTLVIGSLLGLLYATKLKYLVRKLVLIVKMIGYGLFLKTTIYHANDLNTLPQAVICGRLFKRKKVVFDSHEINTSRSGYNHRFYGDLERWLLRYVTICIHENHTRAAYIQARYHFYPEVVHNYPFENKETTVADIHQALDIPKHEPILLYQGGIQTGRGLKQLIEAVPAFHRGVVVLIGDGKIKSDLQSLVASRGLTDRIKFIAKVPVLELPAYTRSAYLGFQLLNNTCFNHYSASSNKLFEYMMSGIPVVACEFPEIKGVVEKEHTGIVVDSHDPQSIAAGVNNLLDSTALREYYRNNALRARESYNWTTEKKKFLAIYEKVTRCE